MTVDELAQEIRRVDGENSLGAGALADALMPFLSRTPAPKGEAVPFGWAWRQRIRDNRGGWEDVMARSPPSSRVNVEDVADLQPLYASPVVPVGREEIVAIMKDKISGYGMDDGYWLINHSSVIEAADAILAALTGKDHEAGEGK